MSEKKHHPKAKYGQIFVLDKNGCETKGEPFPLIGEVCVIGRMETADIRLNIANVSQTHCKVIVEEETGVVFLDNQGHGTEINGQLVAQDAKVGLNHQDIIKVGGRCFRFCFLPPDFKPRPSSKPRRTSMFKEVVEAISDVNGGTVSDQENIKVLPTLEMPVETHEDIIVEELKKEDMSTPLPKQVPALSENGGNSKRVSFGPYLSPEQFDNTLPPATPVKRGATPLRRSGRVFPGLKGSKNSIVPVMEEESACEPPAVEGCQDPPSEVDHDGMGTGVEEATGRNGLTLMLEETIVTDEPYSTKDDLTLALKLNERNEPSTDVPLDSVVDAKHTKSNGLEVSWQTSLSGTSSLDVTVGSLIEDRVPDSFMEEDDQSNPDLELHSAEMIEPLESDQSKIAAVDEAKVDKVEQWITKSPAQSSGLDYSEVEGVERLLQTPIPTQPTEQVLVVHQPQPESPKADYTDVRGVKQLFTTPRQVRATPEADYTNVTGLKRLLRTPRAAPETPVADYTNVSGIKRLMKTPKVTRGTPAADYTNVDGIKRLMKTPHEADYTNVSGVKRLMKTPRVTLGTTSADYSNVEGIERLMQTPCQIGDINGMKRIPDTPELALKSPKTDLEEPTAEDILAPLDEELVPSDARMEESTQLDHVCEEGAVEVPQVRRGARLATPKVDSVPTTPRSTRSRPNETAAKEPKKPRGRRSVRGKSLVLAKKNPDVGDNAEEAVVEPRKGDRDLVQVLVDEPKRRQSSRKSLAASATPLKPKSVVLSPPSAPSSIVEVIPALKADVDSVEDSISAKSKETMSETTEEATATPAQGQSSKNSSVCTLNSSSSDANTGSLQGDTKSTDKVLIKELASEDEEKVPIEVESPTPSPRRRQSTRKSLASSLRSEAANVISSPLVKISVTELTCRAVEETVVVSEEPINGDSTTMESIVLSKIKANSPEPTLESSVPVPTKVTPKRRPSSRKSAILTDVTTERKEGEPDSTKETPLDTPNECYDDQPTTKFLGQEENGEVSKLSLDEDLSVTPKHRTNANESTVSSVVYSVMDTSSVESVPNVAESAAHEKPESTIQEPSAAAVEDDGSVAEQLTVESEQKLSTLKDGTMRSIQLPVVSHKQCQNDNNSAFGEEKNFFLENSSQALSPNVEELQRNNERQLQSATEGFSGSSDAGEPTTEFRGKIVTVNVASESASASNFVGVEDKLVTLKRRQSLRKSTAGAEEPPMSVKELATEKEDLATVSPSIFKESIHAARKVTAVTPKRRQSARKSTFAATESSPIVENSSEGKPESFVEKPLATDVSVTEEKAGDPEEEAVPNTSAETVSEEISGLLVLPKRLSSRKSIVPAGARETTGVMECPQISIEASVEQEQPDSAMKTAPVNQNECDDAGNLTTRLEELVDQDNTSKPTPILVEAPAVTPVRRLSTRKSSVPDKIDSIVDINAANSSSIVEDGTVSKELKSTTERTPVPIVAFDVVEGPTSMPTKEVTVAETISNAAPVVIEAPAVVPKGRRSNRTSTVDVKPGSLIDTSAAGSSPVEEIRLMVKEPTTDTPEMSAVEPLSTESKEEPAFVQIHSVTPTRREGATKSVAVVVLEKIPLAVIEAISTEGKPKVLATPTVEGTATGESNSTQGGRTVEVEALVKREGDSSEDATTSQSISSQSGGTPRRQRRGKKMTTDTTAACEEMAEEATALTASPIRAKKQQAPKKRGMAAALVVEEAAVEKRSLRGRKKDAEEPKEPTNISPLAKRTKKNHEQNPSSCVQVSPTMKEVRVSLTRCEAADILAHHPSVETEADVTKDNSIQRARRGTQAAKKDSKGTRSRAKNTPMDDVEMLHAGKGHAANIHHVEDTVQLTSLEPPSKKKVHFSPSVAASPAPKALRGRRTAPTEELGEEDLSEPVAKKTRSTVTTLVTRKSRSNHNRIAAESLGEEAVEPISRGRKGRTTRPPTIPPEENESQLSASPPALRKGRLPRKSANEATPQTKESRVDQNSEVATSSRKESKSSKTKTREPSEDEVKSLPPRKGRATRQRSAQESSAKTTDDGDSSCRKTRANQKSPDEDIPSKSSRNKTIDAVVPRRTTRATSSK